MKSLENASPLFVSVFLFGMGLPAGVCGITSAPLSNHRKRSSYSLSS